MSHTITTVSDKRVDIVLTRGDSLLLQLALTDGDGETYTPDEEATIRFAMKASYSDEDVVLEKSVPVDTLLLEIEPEDTAELEMRKTYVYDIQLTDENSRVDTFLIGKFKIGEEVEQLSAVLETTNLSATITVVNGINGQVSEISNLSGSLVSALAISCSISGTESITATVSGTESIEAEITVPTFLEADYYRGSYEVTPLVDEETVLETRGLTLTSDVTVLEIPYYETSNESGYTVYIG